VAVVNLEALQSPWYRDHARKNLGLSVPEPEPGPADAAETLTALALGIARAHPGRPAYVLLPRHLALPPGMRTWPSGMVYRLSETEVREPFDRWDFRFRDPEVLTRPEPRDQRRKIGDSRDEMRAGFLRAYATGGEEFFRRGDYPSAEGLLAGGVALAPEAEDLALRLGVSQVQQGKAAEALATFEALVRRVPGSFQAHYNRGNILAELGREAEARAAYEEALRIRPDFDLARKALAETGGGAR
jgi:tetratricopeptide (TPR) repeat protein